MTAETTSRAKRYILWAAMVLVLAVVLPLSIRSFFSQKTPVRTAKASYQDLIVTSRTNGKVEPINDFVSHAPAPGIVSSVHVKEGQKVDAGTLLVTLNPNVAESQLAAAEAAVVTAQSGAQDVRSGGTQDEKILLNGELHAAQLQYQQAQQTLKTLQQLQAKGAASSSEVQGAMQRLNSAQASLATVEKRTTSRYSSLDRSRSQAQLMQSQAALKSARAALSDTIVHAPFAGTVYYLPVKPFDFLNAGEVMVRLADLSKMQIRAYFDEPEIGKLAVGQSVVVTWEARPDKTWHGHIIHTPSTIIPYGTRNVGECLITVDDAKDDLLPNTNVIVHVTTSQQQHVLTLPREALRTRGNQNFVYKIVKGKLVSTPVQIGGSNLTLVEITGGINENDTIALNATTTADLEDGMSVVAAQ